MKAPHLLRVDEAPERFAPLFDAARAEKLRIGWLDWTPVDAPSALGAAAGLGAMRAVSVGEGRTVTVKPLRGEPVLKDLLREHFLGCALVLVRGEVDAPALRADGEGWRVEVPGEAARPFPTEKLVAALRKPRPWE